MSRRGSPAVQVLVVIVVVLIFLYGFYSYHQQHTRLKLSEELGDKFKQKAESLSAQLQVLYEHKTRLEAGIQKEKEMHKATKENLELQLKEFENKFSQEKEKKAAEFDSCKKSAEESKLALEKADLESKRLVNEHQNDISRLKDEIADIKRRYEECERLNNQPLTAAVDKTRLQQPLEIGNNNNKNGAKNAGGDVESMQIVKPGEANLQPLQQQNVAKQDEKVDSVPQNIPVAAAQAVLQPDGKAVQSVNAPVMGDSNQPLHRDDVGDAPVNDVNPPAKQLEQQQEKPGSVDHVNRLPADSNKVNNAETKDDDYGDDIEGQQGKDSNKNGALIFGREGNGAEKLVANIDVPRDNRDGAGL